jgi:uncharacterized surface protein with fasciclin (FAS1) repeats
MLKKTLLAGLLIIAGLTVSPLKAQMVGGAMMVPSKTIPENAMNAKNLTTLVAAVKAAGLVETLSGPGPFTVFAPTNDAFNALPAGTVDDLLKPENKDKLTSVLTYHVVPGRYTAKDLKDGMTLTTVNGQTLKITRKGKTIMVNGAKVEVADVMDKNGVSFVINKVLLPN